MARFRSWSRARRRIVIVTVLAVAVLAVCFLPLPLGPGAKAKAARMLVAWAIDGKRIRGVPPDCSFPRLPADVARVYLVCDLAPPDIALSTDPRVQRLSFGQLMALFEEQGSAVHDEAAVILLWLEEEGPFGLVVGFDSPRTARYGFAFRRRGLLRVVDVDILAME